MKRKNSFMSKVFLWMAAGLVVTGFVTYAVIVRSLSDLQFAVTIWSWAFVILIIQLFLGIGLVNVYKKTSTGVTALLYLSYTALTGLWLGPLLLAYDLQAIITAVVATSVSFVVIAFWAALTKRDLTTWGSFAIMGLLGLIIMSLINMFIFFLAPGLATSINWVLTYFGLAIFYALLAFNIQNLAKMSAQIDEDANVGSLAVIGAFDLYLNILNIFLILLRIFGRR